MDLRAAEGAIDILRRAMQMESEHPVPIEDTNWLHGALRRVVDMFGPTAAGEVAEALLVHELGTLRWPPIAGAALVREALASSSPSAALVTLSMNYLSLYFQELDDAIARSRHAVDQGHGAHLVAVDLIRAIDSLK